MWRQASTRIQCTEKRHKANRPPLPILDAERALDLVRRLFKQRRLLGHLLGLFLELFGLLDIGQRGVAANKSRGTRVSCTQYIFFQIPSTTHGAARYAKIDIREQLRHVFCLHALCVHIFLQQCLGLVELVLHLDDLGVTAAAILRRHARRGICVSV